MAHIFKKRILDEQLKDFEIENFSEKLKIVKKWHDDYHSGTLKTDKETSREQAFNQDFFIKILGYKEKPENPYTLEPKQTTDKGQLPDVVLGYFDDENKKPAAVVELKGANIPLDRPQRRDGNMSPIQQAFKYKTQYQSCPFVIASNFFEFRLFQDTQLHYEMWTLNDLVNPENDYYNFKKFCFLLQANHLIVKEGKSKIEELLSDIRIDEEEISKKFYKEYKELRLKLLRDVYKNNQSARGDINFAIEKVQKIIDRIVFVCFCEDKGLLPEHTLERVLQVSEDSFGSLWSNLKGFFEDIDKGSTKLDIPSGYNGGLFAFDGDLNCLAISDDVLKKLTQLGRYNFEEDMSVNILGHIFEQSISDLEEVRSKANEGGFTDKKDSKRKKDGIFYTPDYIVSYIIKNSLGKYLEEQEDELKKEYKLKEDILDKTYEKRERQAYEKYKQILENVKVLDPACGSGAFLVGVFDYLLEENKRVADILGGDLFSGESFLRSILKNNIYGVDINQESVEITKLSLWLKTAEKGKKLTTLDDNIKCGNSLIDDVAVAGEKAFDWNQEFKEIMDDGGFDIVLGNPPYVRNRALTKEESSYFLDNYKFTQSGFDLATLFIEKYYELLKENGLFGIITTNKFFSARYGSLLREYLISNRLIDTVINFSSGIFEDTPVETSIVISNKNDGYIKYNNYLNKWEHQSEIIAKLKIKNSFYDILANNIIFFPKNSKEELLLNKMQYYDKKISDYYNFFAGTGITNIKKYLQFEKVDDMLSVYTGKAIWRFFNKESEYYISKENINHIRNFDLEKESIVCVKELSTKLRATKILNSGSVCFLNSVTIVQSKNELLNDLFLILFNSKIFSIIYSLFYESTRTHSNLRFKELYISNIPIPNLESISIKETIALSKKMLNLERSFQDKKQKFLSRLITNFEIEKLSKKLENFYELDFGNFVKELEKKKVVLSLTQQDEWEDYFNNYKIELLDIKSKINKTDKEIDKMVYELYDLSDKEIAIIEQS